MNQTTKDARLRELYAEHYTGSTRTDDCVEIKPGFLDAVAAEFGWSIQQAYVATDHLFRPENVN
jgi:hypothetical protein